MTAPGRWAGVALALASAAGVLAGCAGSDASLTEPTVPVTATAGGPAAPSPASSSPTSDTGTPPPPSTPWEPGPGESAPEAKLVAARASETLTTYDVGEAAAVLARMTEDPARREALARSAGPLLHAERWSRGTVLYAQLGGLRDDAASVLVVVEQSTGGPGGDPAVVRRTLDIRLVRLDGRWVLDALASAGGDPVARPDDLPAEAVAVLDDGRISLPDSARWDIHAGRVDRRLLRLMGEIADRTPYGVVSIVSGHPVHVFGSDRESDHHRGLAVDIAIVGGVPVVDDTDEASPTYALVDWLRRHPDVRQVGSPWALDAYGGRSFTDAVHRDHLHVAVTRP